MASLEDTFRGRIVFDGTRTPLKTTLFLLVCLAWLLPGLVGHDPWKTDEAIVFGAVLEMVRGGDWVVFRIAGEPYLERAPLYLWTAGLATKLFGGLLPLHDAARLASGVFMALTLGFLSLASRELLDERARRVAVLLAIGCLGLLIRAHEMSTDLAGLTGVAVALYGLGLASRRPLPGGAVAGVGIGVAFLGEGFVPLTMLLATLAALPFFHKAWRTREYALTVAMALLCALPLVAAWPLLLASASPSYIYLWLAQALPQAWRDPSGRELGDVAYFVRILPWYAWPAWPLAAWSLWRSRRTLADRRGLLLPLVTFVVFLLVLSLFGETGEVNALPLILPLVLLGVAELDALPRGGASALDWFGMMTFFLLAVLIWLGWIAVMTGHPEAVLARIRSEVPGYTYTFDFISFALASLLTLIWLVVVARSLRSTRRALVNWAAGITMVWMLAMTLGVPLVDQARSYRGIATQLVKAMPPGFRCVAAANLGDPQRALLDYFVNIHTLPIESPAAARCQVLLVQETNREQRAVPPEWVPHWRGSRPGDRREAFVLYRRGE